MWHVHVEHHISHKSDDNTFAKHYLSIAAAGAVPVSFAPAIVEENPELLFRMDYYLDAMMLDDLPIEIQNMMAMAGKGLGFLYRYYGSKDAEQKR